MTKQLQEKIQEIMKQTVTDPSAQATIAHLQHELESTRVQVRTEQEQARSAGKAHYEKIAELEQRNTLAMSQTSHVNSLNNAAERRIEELERKVAFGREACNGLGRKICTAGRRSQGPSRGAIPNQGTGMDHQNCRDNESQ